MENIFKKYIWLSGLLALTAIAFGAFAFGLVNMESLKHPNGTTATITVNGDGLVTAPPDIATINATVREDAKTVSDAEKKVETKISQVVESLGKLNINKNDIKTLSYTVNPKYETTPVVNYCVYGQACPPTKTIVTGYEVAETLEIKVRKIDSTGEVVGSLGQANVTETSGPNFSIDNIDELKAKAKTIAIKKAQDKAKATAEALGVSLGAITQFSEDNGGNYPIAYTMGASMKSSAEIVTLPQGESTIKSNVSITYLIK